MARKTLYLHRERTRHGRFVWYVRVRHEPRTRIYEDFGTDAFWAAYRAAVEGAPKPAPNPRKSRGTVAWLIARYITSGEWNGLSQNTRANRSVAYRAVEKTIGDEPIKSCGRGTILASREARKDRPAAANDFVNSMRALFAWALSQTDVLPKGIATNPAADIKPLKRPNAKVGHVMWSQTDVVQFQSRWALGTRERVAMDVLLYTGLRRVDAVKLGRQHVATGPEGPEFTIRTQKAGVVVTAPLLPILARTIAAGPTGDLTFIVKQDGTPYHVESFAYWFGQACTAAGASGTAHGLRKTGAAMAAEGGATEAQLNALFGWADGSKEAALYTQGANRAKMARDARRAAGQIGTENPAPISVKSRTEKSASPGNVL